MNGLRVRSGSHAMESTGPGRTEDSRYDRPFGVAANSITACVLNGHSSSQPNLTLLARLCRSDWREFSESFGVSSSVSSLLDSGQTVEPD